MFHKRNIGREIRLAKSKKLDEISSILKSGERFRVKSEIDGSVVSDYTLPDIAEAACVTVSQDDGLTWQDMAIKYNKEDSADEYAAVEAKIKEEKDTEKL